MNESGITITQALNQIQSWLNAGELEKVIQGCEEILEFEAGNQRALALLKQAKERQLEKLQAEASPAAEAQAPAMPEEDPLKSLEVEESTPEEGPKLNEASGFVNDPYVYRRQEHSKKRLFAAMAVPALLVIVIGGGIILNMARQQQDDLIEDASTVAETSELSYLAANEERLSTMNTIKRVLETYRAEEGRYPAQSQIEGVLLNSELFDKLPLDPRHAEFDKKGKVFGYVYAVYPTIEGENTAYVLSTLFEDKKGFGYAWTLGAEPENYSDYRNLDAENVDLIGDAQ